MELTDKHRKLLASIAPELKEHMENMAEPLFYIYPRVVSGEISAGEDGGLTSKRQRQALYDLGEERAEKVKEYLIEVFAIEREQLQVFQPGILYEKGVRGSVTFMK